MFNSITWGQYLTTIVVFLVLYYSYVAFKYFRWEILAMIGISKVNNETITIPSSVNHKPTEIPEDYLPKPQQNANTSPVLLPFTDEVKAYLIQTENGISKTEIIDALQQLIEKYPVAQHAEYRSELTYFIAAAVNEKYPQLLQANDISQLWN
jgi:hypothetical protein